MSDEYNFPYLTLPAEALNRPIEVLELSKHAYNGLRREGVDNLGDLMLWSEAELLDINLFGIGYVGEIKRALAGQNSDGRALELSRHHEDLAPPAGDVWVEVPYGMLQDKQRLILHSQIPRLTPSELSTEGGSTGHLLNLLKHQFGIRKVWMLLELSWSDIVALDWPRYSLDAVDALNLIESVLASHRLRLRDA